MSKRGSTGSGTYRPTMGEHKPAPFDSFTPSRQPFIPAVVRESYGPHCFSACLYDQPHPKRRHVNFAERYLDSMPAVRDRLEETGYGLNIFCDAAMLQTALSFECGSVYLVTEPPKFEFQQHVWRYYSALLPNHPTIQAYHFRGMDNLLASNDELEMFDQFLAGGYEIKHAPYTRKAGGDIYTPIRGSCSVAGRGIQSLGWWLSTQEHFAPEDWPSTWHNDEDHLARWFNAVKHHHSLFTILDRDMPMHFYRDLSIQLETGMPLRLVRL